MEKGADSELPGWHPKEKEDLTAKAGPTASTTPLLRDARSRGVGTLRDGRPADYLPPGTVGQWPPAAGQWWTVQEGGDPRTDQATKGADS